ncbi:hypothetical protein [Kitasatospora sp. P5_F3]
MDMTAPAGPPEPFSWFVSSQEKQAILREAATSRGVTLHVQRPPTPEEAETLADELMDILIGRGFEADWEITSFGGLVEDVIDIVYPYVDPD